MHIILNEKHCEVRLSDAAKRQLLSETSLYIEMELYFSCLIRKRVYVSTLPRDADYVSAGERLYIGFRPVMTQKCGMDYAGDEPPVTDFPLAEPERFTPGWLSLDYKNGQWQGEFGYTNSSLPAAFPE